MSGLLRFFAYAHLPAHLQSVSKPIGDLADQMASTILDGPQKDMGMFKLLEAKDCFVRAALDRPKDEAQPAIPEHLQRVINEKVDLDCRIDRLRLFIHTNPLFGQLPEREQALMTSQLDLMQDLSDTLWQRINPKKSQ